ncbi:MAG: ATP/GTP-binding protein, partial [Bacilli bacterium]
NTSYNNYFQFKDTSILKVSSFYGMNSTGKSRITMAFAALKELVVTPNHGPLTPYYPFKFDEKTINAPIILGIEFSTSNNNDSPIFRYHVSYNSTYILNEKLEMFVTQKPTLLYERKTQEDGLTIVQLGSTVQNNALLQEITKSVVPSRTFLSVFNRFKIDGFYDAYLFFSENMFNISPVITKYDDYVPIGLEENPKLKQFIFNMLQAADFNILDISIGKTKIKNLFANAPGITAEKDTLFFKHKVGSSEGIIEFLDESLGTKKMVVLASLLYPALSKPSVMIIDELETSLHPDLTKLIVKCFLDETINPYNSQLIFTSHETTLLNLNLLRRDQINFVYKDENTCGTYIKSLMDFHVRKTDSIEKAYIAGRYSTSPEVNEQLLEGIVMHDKKLEKKHVYF